MSHELGWNPDAPDLLGEGGALEEIIEAARIENKGGAAQTEPLVNQTSPTIPSDHRPGMFTRIADGLSNMLSLSLTSNTSHARVIVNTPTAEDRAQALEAATFLLSTNTHDLEDLNALPSPIPTNLDERNAALQVIQKRYHELCARDEGTVEHEEIQEQVNAQIDINTRLQEADTHMEGARNNQLDGQDRVVNQNGHEGEHQNRHDIDELGQREPANENNPGAEHANTLASTNTSTVDETFRIYRELKAQFLENRLLRGEADTPGARIQDVQDIVDYHLTKSQRQDIQSLMITNRTLAAEKIGTEINDNGDNQDDNAYNEDGEHLHNIRDNEEMDADGELDDEVNTSEHLHDNHDSEEIDADGELDDEFNTRAGASEQPRRDKQLKPRLAGVVKKQPKKREPRQPKELASARKKRLATEEKERMHQMALEYGMRDNRPPRKRPEGSGGKKGVTKKQPKASAKKSAKSTSGKGAKKSGKYVSRKSTKKTFKKPMPKKGVKFGKPRFPNKSKAY